MTIPPELNIEELYQKLASGDRVALGRAITLVESRLPTHRAMANALLDKCLREQEAPTFRFAISGAPGVGKSTFIETFGNHVTADGEKLAVLAVDPSSKLSGGSILGDKTRMSSLAQNADVYIRPSAAGDALGGVTISTREVITLCEAAGYTNVCIETVGVGQSETTVRDMCDFMLLLVSPGGGDDLQGIKRGIVELADLIAVNKSDGPQEQLAKETRQHYRQALHLFPQRQHGISVKVVNCSAAHSEGIAEIWTIMQEFLRETTASGYLNKLRTNQNADWLRSAMRSSIEQMILEHTGIRTVFDTLLREVSAGNISVSSALSLIEAEVRKTFGL